jgi:hypothetical protein
MWRCERLGVRNVGAGRVRQLCLSSCEDHRDMSIARFFQSHSRPFPFAPRPGPVTLYTRPLHPHLAFDFSNCQVGGSTVTRSSQ